MASKRDNWVGYSIEVHEVDPEIADRFTTICEKKGVAPGKMFETMVRSFDRGPVKYSLDDRINFGKYSGMLIEDLIRTDTRYIMWLVRTSEWFRLSPGALDLLEEMAG